MSEGLIIFLASNVITVFCGAVILVWKFAETKNSILSEIGVELELLRKSNLEIMAQLNLLGHQFDSKIFLINERQSTLKALVKARFNDYSDMNEQLVKYVNSISSNSERQFVSRRTNFDDDFNSEIKE